MKRSISARAFGALGVAAVLLLSGACSSGSDDEAKDDKKSDDTTAPADTSEETDTTALSDEEFIGEIDGLSAAIEDAGTDLCKIIEVGQQAGPDASPSTPAQVESLITAQASMLRALAKVEPVDETNAPLLNDYADKLLASGEAAGFSVEYLGSDEYLELSADPTVAPAISAYQERSLTECPQPEAPAEGTDGAAAEEPTATVAP